MITRNTTGTPHHGPSNHAGTTGTGTTGVRIRKGMNDHIAPAAQRVAVQPPQAHCTKRQKANDLGRAAVGWNGGLGGLAYDARLLPA